jgi:CBS domain containing-hemolysin-like protein
MLILANAFFVAAEFALVSIRETRVEQMLAAKVAGARAVRRLQLGLDELLPAVQLGVTLCSLALGWLGEPLASGLIAGWLGNLPYANVYGHIAAVTLGFASITYFHVVVGELVPKALALRRAEALALAVAPPMLVFMSMARPALRLLKVSAAFVLRVFDVPLTERSSVHSADELKLIATSARRMGLLPKFEETLIHRSLELDEVSIREIMTPRQKIFATWPGLFFFDQHRNPRRKQFPRVGLNHRSPRARDRGHPRLRNLRVTYFRRRGSRRVRGWSLRRLHGRI